MLLSICIPHYNRFEHLQEIIDSVCKAKSNDFELVITDNCSEKDINEEIKSNDSRVRIIKRNKPVNGIDNTIDSFFNGRGKYALIIIDKDFVDGERLDDFINVLENHPQICGGFCRLNVNDNDYAVKMYDKEHNTDFYYTWSHTSGYFFRKDCLVEEDKHKMRLVKNYNINGCRQDYYMARCATMGDMLDYRAPLVYSLLNRQSAIKSKSYTTTPQNGHVFFEPKMRTYQMFLNFIHMKTLDLPEKKYRTIATEVYWRTLYQCTIGYREILKLSQTCNHYGIQARKVSLLEMSEYAVTLGNRFLTSKCVNLAVTERITIILKTIVKILIYGLKIIFSKNNKSVNEAENTDICLEKWNHNQI